MNGKLSFWEQVLVAFGVIVLLGVLLFCMWVLGIHGVHPA